MEAIRQNGKIILHSNDGISIKMIFRNLTGRNFQGQEYADYISHIAIGSMGFTPGSIEHCRDGGVIDRVSRKTQLHPSLLMHIIS